MNPFILHLPLGCLAQLNPLKCTCRLPRHPQWRTLHPQWRMRHQHQHPKQNSEVLVHHSLLQILLHQILLLLHKFLYQELHRCLHQEGHRMRHWVRREWVPEHP